MRSVEDYAAASARLLFAALPPRRPTVPAQLVGDLGLVGDQPMVLIFAGGATRRAVYLPPHAIKLGGSVFARPQDARADAPWEVVAPNYNVAWGGTWGATTGTWGADDGSTWGVGPPGAYDGP